MGVWTLIFWSCCHLVVGVEAGNTLLCIPLLREGAHVILGKGLCIPWSLGHLIFLLFIYLFLAVLGLLCCPQALSSCGERGLLSGCGSRLSH